MNKLLFGFCLALALVLAAFAAAGGAASTSLPQPNAPLAETNLVDWEYDQILPAAAFNGFSNEYLAVWEDHHWGYGLDWDIYARRVYSNGAAAGEPFGVSWDGELARLAPDVAANPANGQFLVAWEFEYSRLDHDIYARLVAADGTLPGSEIAISTGSSYDATPVVAYNPAANEYLVVWAARLGSDEFDQYNILAQRVSASGATVGAMFNVAAGSLDEIAPAVTYNPALNQYLVVWQAIQSSTTEYGIYGQRLTQDGTLVGSQIAISTWPGDQLAPRLAFDLIHNRYLAVWEEHHWGSANGWYVYGQIVNTDGSLYGMHLMIAGGDTKNRLEPDVVFKPEVQTFLVAWEFEYSTSDHDVYTRRVAYDGSFPEAEQAVVNTGALEGSPALAAGPGIDILAAWEDGRETATMGLDLYATKLVMAVPVLSGVVYEGQAGSTANPLAGVLLDLTCSDSEQAQGTWINGATSDEDGFYALPAYVGCEYYHIVEHDPPTYLSSGSASTGGSVVTSNWIRYTAPLAGKELGGNDFWDYVPGPEDDVPPGNWTDFSPTGWSNLPNATCSIQVEDTFSGLAVGSAAYAYTVDSGATWSHWNSATCSGADGDTTPQTISAVDVVFADSSSSPELNQCKFQIYDMAGNVGESDGFNVLIDMQAPLNPPAITCPSHPASTWSTTGLVNCQWSGATDALSGIAGYSVQWSFSPTTVPDSSSDTSSPSDSRTLGNADDWYLHVRTVDQAGNAASGATDYGPVQIDIAPPAAALTAPADGSLTSKTFTVSWTGSDVPSGVASYDVQVSTNGGTSWSTWLDNVTYLTSTYTGARGQSYSFRVQATDVAGNVSDWSSTRDVTIGVPITVRVRNEAGTLLTGAKVYLDGTYSGATNASGLVSISYGLVGDTLAATYLVYTAPAAKPYHTWSYHVYQTSILIPNTGTPQLFTVANTGAAYQDLTVRKDQAMIGFHVRFWVEWDASSTYLAGLKQGILGASAYLYDVTDGQMFWETVEVYDNDQYGGGADYTIFADTGVWPNGFVGNIADANFGRIYLPRQWGSLPWSNRSASGVMIHEWGHYALYMYDEYLDRNGNNGADCTLNRGSGSAGEPTRASIMDDTGDASELCSNADPNHLHNTNTEQDKINNGETTWDTLVRVYSDSQAVDRWTWRTPETRSTPVVAGPTALPLNNLVTVNVTDANTNVCTPFTETFVYRETGSPVKGAVVTLDRPTGKDFIQGTTNSAGQIVVWGAHNGDTLHAVKGSASANATVSCTTTAAGAPGDLLANKELVPDPFELQVSVAPVTKFSLQVRVKASVALPSAPVAVLWQDFASVPVNVPLVYNSSLGLYTGNAVLNEAYDPRGQVQVSAANAQGSVWRQQAFAIVSADAQTYQHLYSDDNNFEVVLPEGALQADAFLAIQPAASTGAAQGQVQLGQAYQVIVSTGQYQTNLPVVINMRFADLEAGVTADSLHLYRWDEGQRRWVRAGESTVDVEHNILSASVSQLGTFALMSVSGPEAILVYLPSVVR